MLRHTQITLARIQSFIPRLKDLIYSSHTPLAVECAGPVDRISHQEAQKLTYQPAAPGMELGPLWATYWFRVRGNVPEAWRGRRVEMIWVTHSEGTVWRDGQPVQGVNYEPAAPYNSSVRSDYKLWDAAKGGEEVYLEVEVACNQIFGYDFRELKPYTTRLPFVFEQADLALFNPDAWELYLDYIVLADILKNAEPNVLTPWTGHIMAVLNKVIDDLRTDDPKTWPKARERMQGLLRQKNATYQHEVSAIGHSHIDTAWLWPLAETRRKCVRTFANTLAYMEEFPEYKFCCSQAQQYVWIKEDQPKLYERIKAAVKRGQWIPVGGSWIEPDCNIPSGESLVRQYLYGKRFFREEFGVDCKEFWNPDVFGYSGALPQIMLQTGFNYFLTQKLSYNELNKPSHHSFYWEGIDGSRVLTHFPPADTYNGMGVGFPLAHLLYSVKNFKDHDRSNQSMFLFGYGDGGGGPTREMLGVLRRVKDLEGVPRTEQRSPEEFFHRLEKNIQDVPVFVGELYFEWHRGTYTTQANDKRDNRRSEFLLHDVEFLSVLAAKSDRGNYPQGEIEKLWKLLLLNQFHDIIPGSSIREVYEDSARDYAHLLQAGAGLKQRALEKLGAGKGFTVVNTFGWDRTELVELPAGAPKTSQLSHEGRPLQVVSAPSFGLAPLKAAAAEPSVELRKEGDLYVLENAYLRAEFKKTGQLARLLEKQTGREAIEKGALGNQFTIFDDRPLRADAWDLDVFHLDTRETLPDAAESRILEGGPLRAMLEFDFAFGASKFKERASLAADARHLEFECEVEWRQRHQVLKVEFPVTAQALEASFEIQFGYLKRPTHFNTSFDIARFETCGHRWIDLSEPGFGVALFTDSKYGYSVHRSKMNITLLRAPTHPDPEADQGQHRFRFACYPHAGDLLEAEVVRRAFEFNRPLEITAGEAQEQSWLQLDSPHVIIDTVKKAEDSNDVVVRLYETHGVRGTATLQTAGPFRSASFSNLLEETQGEAKLEDGKIALEFRPFQIITLILKS